MDGDAAMGALVSRLRGLPSLGPAIAQAAAPFVLEAAKATAAAGTDPEGKPWTPKKAGGRALEHAADALSVRPMGDVVVLVLSGVNVYHQHGVKGGAPQRRILPDGGAGVPPHIAKAIDTAARSVIGKAMTP